MDMLEPDAEKSPYRVREDGHRVILVDRHGTEFSFAPEEAVRISDALLQAAIRAQGNSAWQRP
jgi:hypothetical protein